jgi:hypothetical protein
VAEVYGSRKRRGRTGRRLLTTLIVLLIIIVGALALLDRFGASYAERVLSDRVAEQVADQKATSEKPDVTIKGVPFLTQVVKGRYQEIKIEIRNFAGPVANGRTIRMPVLDIRAKDVRAPLETLRTRRGNIVATTVTGIGTVDYATVEQLVDKPGLKLAEQGGKLAVTAPLTVLNQQVTVRGTANVAVRNNVVSLRFEQVTADGVPDVPLVQNLLNNYARQISVDLRLPQMPLKLALQKVQPTATGLVVTAGGNEVPLNAGGL